MESSAVEFIRQISSTAEAAVCNIVHDKIRSGDFERAKITAMIISTIRDMDINTEGSIDKEAILEQLIEASELEKRKSNFDWAQFCDSELRRIGPDPDQSKRWNETLKALVDRGVLTLWNTTKYPLVFLALLDLGPSNLPTKSIPNLSDEFKTELVQALIERNKMNIEPYDSFNQGLIMFCLNLRDPVGSGLMFLLPYLAKYIKPKPVSPTPKKLRRRHKNGFPMHHAIQISANFDWLDNVEPDTIKQLLLQQNHKGKEALLMLLPKLPYIKPYLQRIIEDMMKSNLLSLGTLRSITDRMKICGSEWVVQCIGLTSIPKSKYNDIISRYAGGEKSNETVSVNDITKYGNSEFPFYHLPAEVAAIICKDLDAATIMNLFHTCKLLRERGDLREIVAPGEKQLHEEFPLIYCKIKSSTMSHSAWQTQFAKHDRLSSNWKKGKFSVKRIMPALDETDVRQYRSSIYNWANTLRKLDMDENWLLFIDDTQLKLWNCHDNTILKVGTDFHEHDYVNGCNIIESDSSGTIPTFGYYLDRKFVIHRNNTLHTFPFNFPNAHNGGFMESIGNNTILTSNKAYYFDLELGQHFGRIHPEGPENDFTIGSASYNPYNNAIALTTNEWYSRVCIADRNLKMVVSSVRLDLDRDRSNKVKVKFVDEFQVAFSNWKYLTVIDTRMMKQVYTMKAGQEIRSIFVLRTDEFFIQFVSGINKHGRAIVQSHKADLGVIWNLKTVQWEHVINIPPNCQMSPLCNSRYAIFSKKSDEDSFVCLDFMNQ